MSYPNYFGGYQPTFYPPPTPDQLAQLRQQQFQPPVQPPAPQAPPSSGMIWVQGEEGAKAYMVAAGNSVLLMDSENRSFYIKSTDPSGMPMPLRIFDYNERGGTKAAPQAEQGASVEFATKDELNALAARLDALAAKETQTKKNGRKEDASDA